MRQYSVYVVKKGQSEGLRVICMERGKPRVKNFIFIGAVDGVDEEDAISSMLLAYKNIQTRTET